MFRKVDCFLFLWKTIHAFVWCKVHTINLTWYKYSIDRKSKGNMFCTQGASSISMYLLALIPLTPLSSSECHRRCGCNGSPHMCPPGWRLGNIFFFSYPQIEKDVGKLSRRQEENRRCPASLQYTSPSMFSQIWHISNLSQQCNLVAMIGVSWRTLFLFRGCSQSDHPCVCLTRLCSSESQ